MFIRGLYVSHLPPGDIGPRLIFSCVLNDYHGYQSSTIHDNYVRAQNPGLTASPLYLGLILGIGSLLGNRGAYNQGALMWDFTVLEIPLDVKLSPKNIALPENIASS